MGLPPQTYESVCKKQIRHKGDNQNKATQIFLPFTRNARHTADATVDSVARCQSVPRYLNGNHPLPTWTPLRWTPKEMCLSETPSQIPILQGYLFPMLSEDAIRKTTPKPNGFLKQMVLQMSWDLMLCLAINPSNRSGRQVIEK